MLKSSSLCLYSSNFGTFWLKIEQFWLFNIYRYYRISYELWTFAYFDRLCKLEKRVDEIKKKSSPLKLLLVMAAILDTGRRWRTQFWKGTTQGSFQQSLVEIGSVVSEKIFFFFQNCSILSQKVPKFELYKHNDELFNIYY
jgi:hypothetical protein